MVSSGIDCFQYHDYQSFVLMVVLMAGAAYLLHAPLIRLSHLHVR